MVKEAVQTLNRLPRFAANDRIDENGDEGEFE
jgi:hypothetical protein